LDVYANKIIEQNPVVTKRLTILFGSPKRVSLLDRQPVSKTNTQFLHTFDAANASREIRAEQSAIGSFVREPPHSA
jgi:hypothetical protein